MLLTNTASWTYSKRQVCQGVDVVLAFITEPIWVKAFRVRIVLGVTVQPNDGNKEDFSWMYFHRRVRFQYVGSNTHSINSCSWWIESQSFCKYNKTSCFAQKCNLRRLQRVYCVRWCTGVTKMCLYFESAIPYLGTHVIVVWFMPMRKVCPSLCQLRSSQMLTALCSGLLYKISPKSDNKCGSTDTNSLMP